MELGLPMGGAAVVRDGKGEGAKVTLLTVSTTGRLLGFMEAKTPELQVDLYTLLQKLLVGTILPATSQP